MSAIESRFAELAECFYGLSSSFSFKNEVHIAAKVRQIADIFNELAQEVANDANRNEPRSHRRSRHHLRTPETG